MAEVYNRPDAADTYVVRSVKPALLAVLRMSSRDGIAWAAESLLKTPRFRIDGSSIPYLPCWACEETTVCETVFSYVSAEPRVPATSSVLSAPN